MHSPIDSGVEDHKAALIPLERLALVLEVALKWSDTEDTQARTLRTKNTQTIAEIMREMACGKIGC